MLASVKSEKNKKVKGVLNDEKPEDLENGNVDEKERIFQCGGVMAV